MSNTYQESLKRTVLRITLAYMVFGCLWILFSDAALARLAANAAELSRLQSWKGLTFVTATTLIFMTLLWRVSRAQADRQSEITDAHDQANEARFQTYVENAPMALFVADAQGMLVETNRAALELFACDTSGLVGHHVTSMLPEADAHIALRDFTALTQHGHLEGEYQFARRDGSCVWASLRAVRISSGRYMAFALDISARKRVEEELQAAGDRLGLALAAAGMGVWEWNLRTDALQYSKECQDIFGPPGAQDRFARFGDALHPGDAAQVWSDIEAAMADGRIFSAEFRMRDAEGRIRWVAARGRADYAADGTPWRLVSTLQDITDKRRAEERQRQAATVFSSTQDGVVVTDAQGLVQTVNPAFSTITGYTEADILGRSLSLLHSGRQDAFFYQDLWRELLARGYWQGEVWNRRKNGDLYPEWLSISAVTDEAGRTCNYVGIFSDISHGSPSRGLLEHLAQHDFLTDLPNRLQLLSRLEEIQARAASHPAGGAVLTLDLRGFRVVNDSLGSGAGDELLQQAAGRLQDSLGPTDTLARLGGDKFAILLEELSGPQAAGVVAADLIEQLARPFHLADKREVSIASSIGISLFAAPPREGKLLLEQADAALYQAKLAGRNTIRFHSDALAGS